MLIDTHCHLDFPEFDADRDVLLGRLKEGGIEYVINIGSSITGSQKSLQIAQAYDAVYATVGLHPHEADHFNDEAAEIIRSLAGEKKVVALGEVGLDYYKNYSKQENQRKLFKRMILLAKEKNLPLAIHSREAQKDTLLMLKEHMPIAAVVHCFSGDEAFLQECLALGFFISYTCNITYKKALGLRELVLKTPLERLMLETDAPFLSPEGFRGKRNEPIFVKLLAEEIAKIKQVPVEEIARQTTVNAKRFFNLP